jgi:hypothetical protein
MYGAVLLTVLGKAALITNNWTKYDVIAIPGSMAIWWGFIAAFGTVAPMVDFATEYRGVIPRLYTSPVFWLQTFVLAVLCLTRDFAWKYAKRMYRPQAYHHIQEIQKYNIQDYRPRFVSLSQYNSLMNFPLTCVIKQDGTIPKGDSQGPPSPAHAQAARLRLLSSRRESDQGAAGLRYHEEQRTLRRDAKFKGACATRLVKEVNNGPTATGRFIFEIYSNTGEFFFIFYARIGMENFGRRGLWRDTCCVL